MAERLPVALLAGLVSVLTPCVLPLVPGYLSAISAVEAGRLGDRGVGRRVALASLPFVLGVTGVFVVLGAGAAAIGSVLDKRLLLRVVGGAMLFALGLLLFCERYWWLQVALNRLLESVGLDRV